MNLDFKLLHCRTFQTFTAELKKAFSLVPSCVKYPVPNNELRGKFGSVPIDLFLVSRMSVGGRVPTTFSNEIEIYKQAINN